MVDTGIHDGNSKNRCIYFSLPVPALDFTINTIIYDNYVLNMIITSCDTYIHTYIHIILHTYIRITLHTYIHKYIHTHKFIHKYLHIYIHTYIITLYIHMYIHIYYLLLQLTSWTSKFVAVNLSGILSAYSGLLSPKMFLKNSIIWSVIWYS